MTVTVSPVAVEDRIDAADDWFVGEDRDLRFIFADGDVEGIEDWTMVFAVYSRRAAAADLALVSINAAGVAAADGVAAYAAVHVTAAQSTTIGAGNFQYVLSRTDVGHNTVLSLGPAQLRSRVA